MQGRGQTKKGAGQRGRGARKRDHSNVHCEIYKQRIPFRMEQRDQKLDQPLRQQDTRASARHDQQEALRQQLPHQAPARGSQRQPHSDFSLPRAPPRQKQVGEVGAGDQQHNAGCG